MAFLRRNARLAIALAYAVGFLVLLSAIIAYGIAQQGVSRRLILATTTSAVDTGLLDYVKPFFDRRFGANLTWLSLGTGQAMAVASRGDADIILVHDREREEAFLRSGNGTHRVTIMCGDFIIVGPKEDPAGVRASENASDAFLRIAHGGELGIALFVSRGDGSGTHSLELRLWTWAGISPRGRGWYLETGQGMARTLLVANDPPRTLAIEEGCAYTLTDRGTWLRLKAEMGNTLRLVNLFEGDRRLLNPYGLILLNPEKYPGIRNDLAEKFFLFMVSREGQELIASFKIGGEQVFQPSFGRTEFLGLPEEGGEVRYWVRRLREASMEPPGWVEEEER